MEQTSPSNEKKKRLCVVPVCSGERFDLVHKFPNDDVRANAWRRLLNIPMLYNLTLEQIRKRYFICSRHFLPTDYKNSQSRGLNKTAYPLLNLKEIGDSRTIEVNIENPLDKKKPPSTNDGVKNIDNILSKGDKNEKLNQQRTEMVTIANSPKHTVTKLAPVQRRLVKIQTYPYKKMKTDSSVRHLNKTLVEVGKGAIKIDTKSPLTSLKLQKVKLKPKFNKIENLNLNTVTKLGQRSTLTSLEVVEQKETDDDVVMENIESLGTSDSVDEEAIVNNIIEIVHPSYTDPQKFHNFWLRDHCRCSNCYNTETCQRKFNILDIPIDVKPITCQTEDNELSIEWSDGHKSIYNIDLLCRSKYEVHKQVMLEQEIRPILWDKNAIVESDYARVNLNDYLSDDDVAKKVMISLIKYGMAFVEKVPANLQSTEITIKRLFPVQKTFFGEMWSFTDYKAHMDSAYSKEYLAAHNDNTYFSDAAGLLVFHCIQHSGTGGETLLVDGFKTCADLKFKNAAAFERLTTTSLPAEYIEEHQNHKYVAPAIRKDPVTGAIEQIRFNMYDRSILSSIPHDKIMQFYKDYRLMASEIQSPNNEWWFKLTPGTVMIFDNWRLLHGRAQYTGKRTLCGSYVSRTDFMSAARTMGVTL